MPHAAGRVAVRDLGYSRNIARPKLEPVKHVVHRGMSDVALDFGDMYVCSKPKMHCT